MRTAEDIEALLLKLGHPFEAVGDGMWVVRDEAGRPGNIVVRYEPPILALRVKVMEAPRAEPQAVYERLLTLNATELVHGAYGLEGGSVVWVDTLQLENLDFNELQASVEAVELAIQAHAAQLRPLRGAHGRQA